MVWAAAVTNDIVGMGTWHLKVRAVLYRVCLCQVWGSRARADTPVPWAWARGASGCAPRCAVCSYPFWCDMGTCGRVGVGGQACPSRYVSSAPDRPHPHACGNPPLTSASPLLPPTHPGSTATGAMELWATTGAG